MPRRLFTIPLILLVLAACRGTALPTETAAVPDSPTPSPTSTQTPAPRPTGAPSPTPTPDLGPCAFSYFPAQVGSRWRYQVSGSPTGDFIFEQEVTEASATGFVLSSEIEDEIYEHQWECAFGGLTALQFDGVAATGIALAGGRISLETDAVTGVSLPRDLAPGTRWQQVYTISGTQSLLGFSNTVVSGTIIVDYEALRVVDLDLAFGTVQALQVHAESEYDLRVGRPPFAFSPAISGASEMYYVEHLGLVRVEVEYNLMGSPQRTVVELLSLTFP